MLDKVIETLKEHNAILISGDNCPHCMGDNSIISRFLLLKIEWTLKGKTYPCIGLFLCQNCDKVEIDYNQLIKNLRYMVLEMDMKVYE